MKTIEFKYGPKTLHLYMNGSAMFEIEALDETIEEGQADAFSRMMENTPEGFFLICKMAVILANQGELCRRYLQYSSSRVPTEKELEALLSPMQMISLRSAVVRAINAGYAQPESNEGDDIDTGLAELEKKTKP